MPSKLAQGGTILIQGYLIRVVNGIFSQELFWNEFWVAQLQCSSGWILTECVGCLQWKEGDERENEDESKKGRPEGKDKGVRQERLGMGKGRN